MGNARKHINKDAKILSPRTKKHSGISALDETISPKEGKRHVFRDPNLETSGGGLTSPLYLNATRVYSPDLAPQATPNQVLEIRKAN